VAVIPFPAGIPFGWDDAFPDLWAAVEWDDGIALVPYRFVFPIGSTLDRSPPG
jgi:hypothetical protein